MIYSIILYDIYNTLQHSRLKATRFQIKFSSIVLTFIYGDT